MSVVPTRLPNTVWCNEIGSLTSLMHETRVHPVTAENQFLCTRLYGAVVYENRTVDKFVG